MRTIEIAELIWGLVCPAVFGVLLSYLIGLWVFGPLHERAVWKPPQTSFRIADIIILLAQLQIAGGLLFALLPHFYRLSEAGRVGITLGVWILITVWWWTGVRMLAKAKVDYARHRWLFLGVFVPLGYGATLGLLFMPVACIVAFAMLLTMISLRDLSYGSDAIALVLLLAGNAATIGTVFATRAFCRKIVARAKDDVAYRDGVALGPLVEAAQPLFVREHLPMASDREVKFFEEPKSDGEPVV